MNEIETVEWVPLVFDAPVHVSAANLAGVPLNDGGGIDDLELVAVFENGDVFARHDGNHREGGPLRLPAFGAAASMIVSDVTFDADLYRPVLAFANQRAAGESARALPYSAIDGWMEMNCHGPILLFEVLDLVDDDRTDRLARVHQVESLVDVLKLEDVSDHRIDLNLSVHVPVDDFRHVGAATRPAERRTLPDPAGNELERAR